MTEIAMSYDRQSDFLEILFEKPTPDEQAFELNFNIVLFVNPHSGKPINLTIIDYKRLLQMDKIPLDNLKKLPVRQQRKMRELVTSEPVSNFLKWVDEPRLKKPYVRILNPQFQELLAA
jgi:hypothetical protein